MTEILLVEDDKSLASGIALAIQTEDKKVLVCNTFQSAKEVLEKHNFQLIILDIGLPDGSGLELLKEYRIKLQVPIIMLTANDLETEIGRASCRERVPSPV